MRLNEIENATYYLSTSSRQPIGCVVAVEDELPLLEIRIEQALEAERPEGCQRRERSIFLWEKPQSADYNYMVEPIAPIERNHIGWLQGLNAADPSQDGVARYCAQGYWTGAVCREYPDARWEIRCAKIRILKRIGGSNAT